MNKTYRGQVTELKPNQFFVFGSNTQGRHGKGSALVARQKFGAIYGQAEGLQGQSYAIVTKDLTKSIHPSISVSSIKEQIILLYYHAEKNPNSEFFIAYNGKQSNLNGYSSNEMANMFNLKIIPENIIFEEEFLKLILGHRNKAEELRKLFKNERKK